MNNEVLIKLTNLQNKTKDLILFYHQIKNQKQFNYTTPKEKSDYEYLYKIHKEKLDYLKGEIKEKIENIKLIEKESKENIEEYNKLKELNNGHEEKKKKILDDLNLYEKYLNELQELINNFKILITKRI
jgi:hypothetical protein